MFPAENLQAFPSEERLQSSPVNENYFECACTN